MRNMANAVSYESCFLLKDTNEMARNEIQSLQNQLPTLNNEITQLQQLADLDSHLGAQEPTRWNGL